MMMGITEQRRCSRYNNEVSNQVATDDADGNIKGGEAYLLLGGAGGRDFASFFTFSS
jgi:hypothetical protein